LQNTSTTQNLTAGTGSSGAQTGYFIAESSWVGQLWSLLPSWLR
jgi:hypothetical protein